MISRPASHLPVTAQISISMSQVSWSALLPDLWMSKRVVSATSNSSAIKHALMMDLYVSSSGCSP